MLAEILLKSHGSFIRAAMCVRLANILVPDASTSSRNTGMVRRDPIYEEKDSGTVGAETQPKKTEYTIKTNIALLSLPRGSKIL